ncbi:nucleotidyltransferase family protein [Dyadobacter sp. CY326]|uniref:nucleotidyltransferase family protein n=1 Tax=Dyadobacter sp. CY326 TaxID=2907300 RepID=UPI001F4250D8|nr:nucleotidyltransferase family protein [Dyadobacter sp. CY326]MCE7066845.1 nucleotidyltransferase family protein [Dyadobacter sp. CY326]
MPNLKISPELALLIQAALKSDHIPVPEIHQDIHFDKLTRLAKWHQVRPLLLHYIEAIEVKVPKQHSEALKDFAMGQAVTNMAFLGISVNLYKQLLAKDVKAFLMKGAIWAWLLYENPTQREFGDIDFFINDSDLNKSLLVLGSNGFQPDAYRQYLVAQKALRTAYIATDYQLPLEPVSDHTLQSLEVQWRPTYPRYCYNLSWEELSEDMISVNMSGSTIQIPNMENQLLMMVIHHGGVEQWDKLKYMADFVRLLSRHAETMDWAYIQSVTKRKGFNRLLMESLGMAYLLTGEKIFSLETNVAAFPSERFRDAILSHWENERPALKSKSWRIFLYNMRVRDNLKVKLSILAAHLSYLTNWQLLWHKALWYKKHRF